MSAEDWSGKATPGAQPHTFEGLLDLRYHGMFCERLRDDGTYEHIPVERVRYCHETKTYTLVPRADGVTA